MMGRDDSRNSSEIKDRWRAIGPGDVRLRSSVSSTGEGTTPSFPSVGEDEDAYCPTGHAGILGCTRPCATASRTTELFLPTGLLESVKGSGSSKISNEGWKAGLLRGESSGKEDSSNLEKMEMMPRKKTGTPPLVHPDNLETIIEEVGKESNDDQLLSWALMGHQISIAVAVCLQEQRERDKADFKVVPSWTTLILAFTAGN